MFDNNFWYVLLKTLIREREEKFLQNAPNSSKTQSKKDE